MDCALESDSELEGSIRAPEQEAAISVGEGRTDTTTTSLVGGCQTLQLSLFTSRPEIERWGGIL